ncbi:tyrosine-type recombinase/integrase [Spartinivicinus poritis]|uniref:Tyrosine-type recombinase/integrase n=1 Tax=Spartinivicinus poritis TaxID=2994640 RepID=A0ABT5UEM4_9GAMM|nr:tyrosine-type recombinase/integrase [Spartinivicinus sp. A2-2]MDE1464762.1 tyrosine-type recombinase/integrase [Spartinivicinus sp. A2-2]
MSAAANVKELVKQKGWTPLADTIVSREGVAIDTSGDRWVLPVVYRYSTLNFSRVKSVYLKWSIKKCIIDQVKRVSSHSGCVYWSDISAAVVAREREFKLDEVTSPSEFEEKLITLFETIISVARLKHRLWALYRPIQWYLWCAENYPELGFSLVYAQELEGMVIPGNPKGEAVREEDPGRGPLHRSLEQPLLIKALKEDKSSVYSHLQQKVAVALSIAFGRNPANLTYLKQKDLSNIAMASSEPCYVLKMPRIKKRQLDPRDDMLDEYLEPAFAVHLLNLIEASKSFSLSVNTGEKILEIEKPLFIKNAKNSAAVATKQWKSAFNMASKEISGLLQAFVKRHNIISPLTGELMHVTPRRLRYTLATGLVAEGISKRELARILDHTDTQHVQVYFEMAGNIVEHLDKASAKTFSKYINFFKGKVINDNLEAINGDRDDKHLIFVDEANPREQSDIGVCGETKVCHLDPPYSCYLCPKFQPYRYADHEHVLECLLEGRQERIKKYESARLGVQLDEVIAAVAQVADICAKEIAHG